MAYHISFHDLPVHPNNTWTFQGSSHVRCRYYKILLFTGIYWYSRWPD